MCVTEPEIKVHRCPDKMSNQILKCSDILKYGQTLLQCMQILAQFVKYAMKCKAH